MKHRYILVLLLLVSVMGVYAQDVDGLRQRLLRTAEAGQVFMGHHDDTFYGHSWTTGACERSDLEELCGHRPMVLSVDLCPLELENGYYMSGSTWAQHRRAIQDQHRRGGITTISWHMYNPLTHGTAWDVSNRETVANVLRNTEARQRFLHFLDLAADYILSLRDDEGQLIPLLFRPFHEAQGSWFWWGRDLCTARQYRRLWRLTRQYLTDRGCTNLLYCFSLSGLTATEDDYLERFPGRRYVDVLGTEVYRDNGITGIEARRDDFIRRARQNLSVVERLGLRWGMPVCVAESGGENTDDPQWWSRAVLPAVEGFSVSYINFWANQPLSFGGGQGKSHCTYPGAVDADDFMRVIASGRLVMCR